MIETKKNKVGRPPKFKTAEELQAAIDDYFENGITVKEVINHIVKVKISTITDLALYIGFDSRQSFYDYEKNGEFKDIIKLARKRIEPTCNKKKYNYKEKYTANNRRKERLKLDNEFRLRTNFAVLLRQHLKNKNKNHTFDIVGYSVKDLMIHLESKFKDGMTWDNYGSYWHVDHIVPASMFNHEDKEQFKTCWALENLQPLEAKLNLIKGDRLIY
jgi:hypothetical protein